MIKSLRSLMLLIIALSLAAVGMAATASAQDATPQASPASTPSEGYPVAIHQGSCESPNGDPASQLDNAISIGVDDQESTPAVVGQDVSNNVFQTSGAIDFVIDDLASEEHVVAVHASDEEFGTIVSCGQIAGVKEDGKLIIALTPIGEHTVVGIAILDEDNAGVFDLSEGQTRLTVYIFDPASHDSGSGT